MQKKDKLKITVSSNVPTDKALKNFYNQLYKMLLDADKKKMNFIEGEGEIVKVS